MIQLLPIVLAAAIVLSGIVGFAWGFLRRFPDQYKGWQWYRGRFWRQILAGFIASLLIGLVPSVWGVLILSVLASVLIGHFPNLNLHDLSEID